MDNVTIVELMIREADQEIIDCKERLIKKLVNADKDSMIDISDEEWYEFKTALEQKALLKDILDRLYEAENN